MKFHIILFILSIWLRNVYPTITKPMNGNYTIANPYPNTSSTRPFHRGRYIDVYSHNISTVYSEVYWTMQPDIPLPPEFVSEFANKIVALTGYEVDSVRTFSNGSEQHVPLYDQYNHHHNAYVVGAATTLVDVGPAGSSIMPSHGMIRSRWELRDLPKVGHARLNEKYNEIKDDVTPTAAYIVDGNGGEYRKSLHATHKHTAMLVESPNTFRLQPMMINTKNPEQGKGPGEWKLYPSEAYGGSRGATPPKNSLYSPLLECPCTDRKKKVITSHTTLESGICPTIVKTSESCFTAVAALGLLPIIANQSISESSTPAGCFVKTTVDGYAAFYNTMQSTVDCGPTVYGPIHSQGFNRAAGVNISIILNEDPQNCEQQPKVITGEWKYLGDPYGPSSQRSPPYTVTAMPISGKKNIYLFKGTVTCKNKGCQGIFDNSSMTFIMKSGFELNATISADWSSMTWSNGVIWHRRWKCPGNATITMSGPSDMWFGVGFDAETMADQPYSIIIDSNGKVQERRIGNHDRGMELNRSVYIIKQVVRDGIRIITLRRTLRGATSQHFTFDAGVSGIPFISAVGNTPELAYHKARAGAALMLVEVGSPLCVCSTFGHTSGSIDGVPFHIRCQDEPISDLVKNKNDVCDITTYGGGLKCCSHKSILLDKNQTVPTEIDTYRMKFRIYYETYTNQSNAFFMFWTNEQGAGEYDIPQCKKHDKTCVYTTTSTFRVRDSMRKCRSRSDVWCAPGWDENKDVMLLRAGMHCHAPACINETLYNADSGEVLCFNKPLLGEGTYPGSGQTFNEKAYAVGIPPCLWGSKDEGLLPPPQVSLDTKLRSVKHVNNTYYHFGVMAQWQMRGMWVSSAQKHADF